jgi:hypothetical protein
MVGGHKIIGLMSDVSNARSRSDENRQNNVEKAPGVLGMDVFSLQMAPLGLRHSFHQIDA